MSQNILINIFQNIYINIFQNTYKKKEKKNISGAIFKRTLNIATPPKKKILLCGGHHSTAVFSYSVCKVAETL